MSQIYYPTDFSPCAENALKFATHLAKATKSSIEVIHEIDIPSGSSTSMISQDSMGLFKLAEDDAKQKLEQIQEKLKDEGVAATTKIIFGNKLVDYLQNCEEQQSSFIVLGTKGSSNIENRLFGSVTHKIIRQVSNPVMVVPLEAEFDGLSDILFAADYTSMNPAQFEQLTNIGTYFHSSIHAVHIMESDAKESDLELAKDLEKNIRSMSKYQNIDFQMLYAKNIEERLDSMIREQNMSMLVLVTKKRSFFEQLFGESLTKKMVYHANIPMLVFHKK